MSGMEFKDYFSTLAQGYSQFRPTYPDELFKQLANLTPHHDHAWDVGCGNGQASVGLAKYFTHVSATDASAQQIAAAAPHPRIDFKVATAEASPLDDASVDFILIAQALHWFNFDRFYQEVRRVARKDAVIAAVAYEVFRVTPEIDTIVTHFYDEIIAPYWKPEREYVQQGYRTIPFPFSTIEAPAVNMSAQWTLDQLMGYFATWSATKGYIEDKGASPLPDLQTKLAAVWPEPGKAVTFTWPLVIRMGRVHT